jgi:predicted MFS family arabinose efflux permease
MIARSVQGRLHYAWVVAGMTFLTLLFSAGFRSTPSVLMVPLQHEFGWSRASISVAVSINLVLFGLSSPFAAALMDRFGIKRVVLCALLLVASASSLTTLIQAAWQFALLWGLVIGAATGAMASVLAATVANRWFHSRRGLIMGVLSASSASGQIGFLPLLAFLASHTGWRSAAMGVTVVALLLVPFVAVLLKDRPGDVGLLRYGADASEPVAGERRNPVRASIVALSSGMRSGTFWLLAGSFFVCGASTNGLIGTHLIPAAMDRGMSEVTAASLLATVGFFDIIGTIFSGWLTDRWDSRRLLAWYYGLRGLSLFLLPFALRSAGLTLVLFIVFYGLDWVATVPPTAALARKSFGAETGTVMYGWIYASHQLGAASAAFGGGVIRTWLGDYLLAFLIAGALCFLAALAVTRIPVSIARRGPTLAQPVPA